MAYIPVDPNSPGIIGLLQAYPDTARHLSALAEEILRNETETLSFADRETIAGFVSELNNCTFCAMSHAGLAEELLQEQGLVKQAVCDLDATNLSDKMKALLSIARTVTLDPTNVTEQEIQRARTAGANDDDIHATVLIAAAFCMYNRYVMGLGTEQPDDPNVYTNGIKMTIENGYLRY